MAYLPCEIFVERIGRFSWMATLVYRDDGEGMFRGCDMEEGPFAGWTHRRAWKKAYKAAGKRLYDFGED